MYFDLWNFDAAWTKLTELYNAKLLFGITKIGRANRPDPDPKKPGMPLIACAGPCTNVEHCLRVGRNLVHLMAHKRQKCNGNFAGQIYYKMSKKGLLYPNGPPHYAVKYE